MTQSRRSDRWCSKSDRSVLLSGNQCLGISKGSSHEELKGQTVSMATQHQETESLAAGKAPIASQQQTTQEAETPSREPLPPHIIVTCEGDRIAFGRYALLQMDYEVRQLISLSCCPYSPFTSLDHPSQGALDVFFDEFLEPTDSVKIDVRMIATFWHKHGGNDADPVRLHPSSWKDSFRM